MGTDRPLRVANQIPQDVLENPIIAQALETVTDWITKKILSSCQKTIILRSIKQFFRLNATMLQKVYSYQVIIILLVALQMPEGLLMFALIISDLLSQ